MLPKRAKRRTEPRSVIKKVQWDMPVTYDPHNQPISLRDYVKGDCEALPFSSLSDEQRVALAAKRIELRPDFDCVSVLAGVVSRSRALQEVRAKSELGRRLIEIETRVVLHLIDEAQKRRRSHGQE
jgi:hypothetical protein